MRNCLSDTYIGTFTLIHTYSLVMKGKGNMKVKGSDWVVTLSLDEISDCFFLSLHRTTTSSNYMLLLYGLRVGLS